MRSRTYAYNGIILGILFGMAAGAYTESLLEPIRKASQLA